MNKLSLLNKTYDVLYALCAQSSTTQDVCSSDVLIHQVWLLIAFEATDQCDALMDYCDALDAYYFEHKYKQNPTFTFRIMFPSVLFTTSGIIGMLNGMDPEDLVLRAERNQKALRKKGFTGITSTFTTYATAIELFMALYLDDVSETLTKMQKVMKGWKEDHPWVTGHNDLFYGLLHAMQNSDPAQQVELTEACFQALKRGGYRAWGPWADELQASAQVVSLWPNVNLDTLEERYATITKLLDEKFSFFGPNIRPIAALIAGTDLNIQETIPELLNMYDLLNGGSRETRLMVVLSLMLLDRYGGDEILKARLIDIVFAQAIATYADELRKQD